MPLTANTLAKIVHGISDNLLLAAYLSARCPVMVAPAMDLDMWKHPSTRRNMEQLILDQVFVIPPGTGELASGLYGEGRMAEPEEQFNCISTFLQTKATLIGKSVLVTAGPTHEAIDPVRFIGNHSSGKMGFALALICARRGANVHVVHGPVSASLPSHPNIVGHSVTSAIEMHEQCLNLFPEMDWAICAAAVSDYRPDVIQTEKIKKQGDELHLRLIKNPDILETLGNTRQNHQTVVGFALETENEIENAKRKLEKKKADLIVMNSLRSEGAGFGSDNNHVWLVSNSGTTEIELASKEQIAQTIVDAIELLQHEK
jgi:phosphopantothenoylcysteine decarboxylase/phosphopantothenate--cysteine ligase